jgi:hypothetical protein
MMVINARTRQAASRLRLRRTQGRELQMTNLQFAICNFKSQISNFKSQISNLKSQISNLKSRICRLKSQICNLKSQIRNLPLPPSALRSPLSPLPSPLFILHFALCIFHFAFLFSSPARAESPITIPIDGAPFRAELLAADADGRLVFNTAGQKKTLPAAELVRWGHCPEQGRAGGLVLVDGSLLTAETVAADKDRLTADSDIFGTLKLPLESLAGVIFHPPSDQFRRDQLVDRLVQASGDSDRLILDNGDELVGLVDGVTARVAALKTDAGPVEVRNDRVTAIVFNPALRMTVARTAHVAGSPHAPRAESPAAAQLRYWTAFTDGSRLLADRLLIDGHTVKLAVVGQSLATPRSSLAFLQPLGGRVVYLSDLKPSEYHQTPFLVLPWPCCRDRNVTGSLLRAGNRLYLKGLGLHSSARLVYELRGQGSGGRGQGSDTRNPKIPKSPNPQIPIPPPPLRFDALIAIDDSTGRQGSVIFRVLVDGQERFASPIVRGGDAPLPVSVDLRGAKKLELLVDYADRADVLDHANWLDARIVLQAERNLAAEDADGTEDKGSSHR